MILEVLHIKMKINICIHIDLYVYLFIKNIVDIDIDLRHIYIYYGYPQLSFKGIGSSPPIFHLAPRRLPPGGTTGSCHGAPSDTWPYGRDKVDHPMTWRPVVNNHGDPI